MRIDAVIRFRVGCGVGWVWVFVESVLGLRIVCEVYREFEFWS